MTPEYIFFCRFPGDFLFTHMWHVSQQKVTGKTTKHICIEFWNIVNFEVILPHPIHVIDGRNTACVKLNFTNDISVFINIYSYSLSASFITGWWAMTASPILFIYAIWVWTFVYASTKQGASTMSNCLICGGDFNYLLSPLRINSNYVPLYLPPLGFLTSTYNITERFKQWVLLFFDVSTKRLLLPTAILNAI